MGRKPSVSLSSKMRKKRAAARAAKAAAAPPPEPEPEKPTTEFNPPPAPMPKVPEPPSTTTTDWDEAAILLLRRLGKRHVDTRQKAAAELKKVIQSAPEDAGQAFLAHLARIFGAVCEDGSGRVREAAIEFLALAVTKFKNKAKAALPRVVPYWIAARRDADKRVSMMAKRTIDEAFGTEKKRAALAAFAGNSLRDFCWEQQCLLYSDDALMFKNRAAKICAVVEWCASVTKSELGAVAEFVDDVQRPLVSMATGMQTSNGTLAAPASVANAGIALLYNCSFANATPQQLLRAETLAEIVLRTLGKDPSMWGLLLVLFNGGWGIAAFGWGLPGLEDALVNAVSSKTPPDMTTLYMIFERLPKQPTTMRIAMHILNMLRPMLGIDGGANEGGKPRESVPQTYTLAVAPGYLECARYMLVTGARAWEMEQASQDGLSADVVCKQIANDHIAPFAQGLFVGDILPLSRTVSGTSRSRTALRKAREARDSRVVRALAKALAVLDVDNARGTLQNTPEVFLSMLGSGKQSAVLLAERFAALLRGMPNSPWARLLASAVVTQIVDPKAGVILSKNQEAPLALLRVLADSVRAVPRLTVAERPDLRSESAKYAVERAHVEPDAAGVVLAWAGWAKDVNAGAIDADERAAQLGLLYADNMEVTFGTLASMVQTHGANQPTDADEKWWKPYEGITLEKVAAQAARALQLRSHAKEAALELVTAVVKPRGGAKLSDATYKGALLAVADCLRKRDIDATECVDLVLGGLADNPNDVVPEQVVPFAATAVAWCERLSYSATKFLQKRASGDALKYAKLILDEFEAVLLRPSKGEEEEAFGAVAERWKAIVEALADDDESVSHEMHALLLNRFEVGEHIGLSEELLEYMLEEVTPVELFGEDVDAKQFVFAYRLLCKRGTEAAKIAAVEMEEMAEDLGIEARVNLAREAIETLFGAKDRHLFALLASTVKAEDKDGEVEETIAQLVAKAFVEQKKAGVNAEVAVIVVEVVEVSTACSRRRTLPYFKDILVQASNALRRDPDSREAQFGAMLLCAALVAGGDDSYPKVPDWLVDLVAVALKSVRRLQETSTLQKGEKKKETLAVGAVLLSRVLEACGVGVVALDEWRFWPGAVQSALYDALYVDSSKPERQSAVANLASLAVQLVRAQESVLARRELKLQDGAEIPVRIESDTMCRNGAWAAVNFLAALEKDVEKQTQILPASSGPLAELIIVAAERGVLIPKEGELPLSINKVYALLPLLGSGRDEVRQAVSVVVVRAASMELPKLVARSFPPEGFSDDDAEAAFAKRMVPEAIQQSLEWSGEMDDVFSELRYFMSWRIFLELVSSKAGATEVNEDGENISFRRMGVEYLRRDGGVFEKFFDLCMSTVVQGSTKEKDIATDAAVQVLSTASIGSRLQGMQLAEARAKKKRDEAKDEEEELETEEMRLDKEAISAAGAAFALSLQRLPALTRQLGLDRQKHSASRAVEAFVEERISRLLIAAEVDRVRAWGAFGGSGGEAELAARGSVAGREVVATYTYSDVSLEIALKLPACYPLKVVEVESKSGLGMSEAKWRKTVLGMATVLRMRDGSVVEAIELWRRNLDKTFAGAEECPICYSVLHLDTASLPKMKCRTCKHLFHSECLCRWFKKSNSAACPLCRSVF